MDKEQQIEEMAKTIFLYVDSKGKKNVYIVGSEFADDLKTYSHNYGVAEAIYNAGYRQIDENCAVITKDELKEYKRQAVKEVLEKLKKAIHERDYVQGYAEIGLIDEIDELLKEYE